MYRHVPHDATVRQSLISFTAARERLCDCMIRRCTNARANRCVTTRLYARQAVPAVLRSKGTDQPASRSADTQSTCEVFTDTGNTASRGQATRRGVRLRHAQTTLRGTTPILHTRRRHHHRRRHVQKYRLIAGRFPTIFEGEPRASDTS